jgi:hypothetical protein
MVGSEEGVRASSKPRQTYTLEEVVAAERPAWASGHVGRHNGAARFYYDGINFWRWYEGSVAGPSPKEADLPAAGWWHRAECGCSLCQRSFELSPQ